MTPEEEAELRRSIEASQRESGATALQKRAFGDIREPEEVAQDHDIARQVGVPAPAVPAQRDTYQRMARALDAARRTESAPRLQRWLDDGDNYALAKNDLDILARIEQMAKAFGQNFAPDTTATANGLPVAPSTDAGVFERTGRMLSQAWDESLTGKRFRAGQIGMNAARLDADEVSEILDTQRVPVNIRVNDPHDQRDALREEGVQGDFGEVVEQAPSWLGAFEAGVRGTGHAFLTGMRQIYGDEGEWSALFKEKPVSTVVGTAALSPIAVLAGVGSVPGGWIEGTSRYTYRLEAGNAYEAMTAMRDINGAAIPPEIAAKAARNYGIVAADIENIGGMVQFKSLADNALRAAGLKATSALGKRMVMSMALRRYGVEIAENAATEFAEEASQRAAEIAFGEAAKKQAGGNWAPLDAGETIADIAHSGKIGAYLGGGMAAVTNVPALVMDMDTVAATQRNQEAFMAFVEAVQGAQIARLSPDAAEQAVAAVTEGTPLQTVGINTDAFVEYFQSKGIDPERAASELGVTAEAFDAAYRAHGELRIDTDKLAYRMIPTPHYAALADHIRVGDSFTPAEARARTAAFENEVAKVFDDIQASADTVEAARKVGEIMREKFARAAEEGGPRPEYANRVATLWEAFFGTLATHIQKSPEMSARLGSTPEEIFSKFGFDVRGAERANDPVNFRDVRGEATENPWRWEGEEAPREDAFDGIDGDTDGDGLVDQPTYLDRAREAMGAFEGADAAAFEPEAGRELYDGLPDDRLIEALALAYAAQQEGDPEARAMIDALLGEADDMLYVEEAALERANEIMEEDAAVEQDDADQADADELRAEIMERLESLPPDVPRNSLPADILVGVAIAQYEAPLLTLEEIGGDDVVLRGEGGPIALRRDALEAAYEQEGDKWRLSREATVGFWTATESGLLRTLDGEQAYEPGATILIDALGDMRLTRPEDIERRYDVLVEEDIEDRASEVFQRPMSAKPTYKPRGEEAKARRALAIKRTIETRRAAGLPMGGRKRKGAERDLILDYLDHLDEGLSAGEAKAQIDIDYGYSESVEQNFTKLRKKIRTAISDGKLPNLAAKWAVTEDVLTRFATDLQTSGTAADEIEGKLATYYNEGRSNATIAELTGITTGSVKARISTIRRVQRLAASGKTVEEISEITKRAPSMIARMLAAPHIQDTQRTGESYHVRRERSEEMKARLRQMTLEEPTASNRMLANMLHAEGFPTISAGRVSQILAERPKPVEDTNGNRRLSASAEPVAERADGGGTLGGASAPGDERPGADPGVRAEAATRTDAAQDIALAGGFRRRGVGALPLAPESPWRKPLEGFSGEVADATIGDLPLSLEERARRHALFEDILPDTSVSYEADAHIYRSGDIFDHPFKGIKQVPAGRVVPSETRRYVLDVPLRAHRTWDAAFASDVTYIEVEVIGKMAMIHGANTHPALRGGGVGAQLYRDVIDSLLAEGIAVYSDQSISPDAMRVYQKLRMDGYSVTRVSNEGFSTAANGQLNTKDGTAHFRIAGRQELTEVLQSNSLREANAKVAEELIAQGVLLTDFRNNDIDDQFRWTRQDRPRGAAVSTYTLPSTRSTAKMDVTFTEAPSSISSPIPAYADMVSVTMEYAGSTTSGRRGQAKGSATDAMRIFSLLYSIWMYDMRERAPRGYAFVGATPELTRFYAYTMSKIDFPGYTAYYSPRKDTFFFMRDGETPPDASTSKALRGDNLPEVYQDIFYSALERGIEALQVKSATPEDWRKLLITPAEVKRGVQRGPDNKPMMDAEGKPVMTERVIPESVRLPGVKRDEIEWVGILDWLDFLAERNANTRANDTEVSKDDVLQFVRERGVKVDVHGARGVSADNTDEADQDEAMDFDEWREQNAEAIYEREGEILQEHFDNDYNEPDLEIYEESSAARDVRESLNYVVREIASREASLRSLEATVNAPAFEGADDVIRQFRDTIATTKVRISNLKSEQRDYLAQLGELPVEPSDNLNLFTGTWTIFGPDLRNGGERPMASYAEESVARTMLEAMRRGNPEIADQYRMAQVFDTSEEEAPASEFEQGFFVYDEEVGVDMAGPFATRQEAERHIETYKRFRRDVAWEDFTDGDNIWALEQAEQELWDNYQADNDFVAPQRGKYAEWATKGGEDYQMVRLTLPGRTATAIPATIRQVENGFLIEDVSGKRIALKQTLDEAEALVDTFTRNPVPQRLEGDNEFTDTHVDEGNILGWIRTKTYRDGDGRKVLFIEEVQPQWQQKGLDRGFRAKAPIQEQRAAAKALKDATDALEEAKARLDAVIDKGARLLEPWQEENAVDFGVFSVTRQLLMAGPNEWIIRNGPEIGNADPDRPSDLPLEDEVAVRAELRRVNDERRRYGVWRIQDGLGVNAYGTEYTSVEDAEARRAEVEASYNANEAMRAQMGDTSTFEVRPYYEGGEIFVHPPTGVDMREELLAAIAARDEAGLAWEQAGDALRKARGEQGSIADMPFKQTQAAAGLFMKWAIRYAADNEFDAIAWTTGAQQAKRYNQLVNHIDELRWQPDPNDPESGRLAAVQNGVVRKWVNIGKGHPDIGTGHHQSDGSLNEVLGKEVADKLRAAPTKPERYYNVEGYKSVSGLDLEFGGEGMKGFYDKILVNITNDLIKKSGQRVKPLGLGIDVGGTAHDVPGKKTWEVHSPGPEVENGVRRSSFVRMFSTEAEAAAHARELDERASGYGEPTGYRVREYVVPDNGVPQPSFEINDELRSIAMGGFPYLQSDGSTKMGSTMFDRWGSANSGELRAAVIRFFESQNLATTLHESGHVFLEVFQTVANDKDAPPELRAMWNATMAWMGKEPGEALTREDHELWARTFEAYLKEGKAPSLALRDVFRIFQSWLVSIYRAVKNALIGRDGAYYGVVNLSPEISEVFDRLIASEEEIAVARQFMEADRPFFQTREESGMSEAVWADYVKDIDEARIATETALRVKAMEKYARQERREWRVMREGMRPTATRDVDTDPARRAYDWLADGTWRPLPPEKDEDGNDIPPDPAYDKPADLPDMRLDAKTVALEYGDEALEALPRALKPATPEDVEALLADAQEVKRAGKVKKALRLSAWVRKRGGVKDDGGDIAAAIGGAKARPGVINNATGRNMDDLAMAAWEDGYFGPKPGKASADPETGELFQLAGPKSKLADKEILKHAKRMWKSGDSNAEIWAETGKLGQPWYRNENGEWITEFEDGEVRIIADGDGKYGELIAYETATDAYPKLAKFGVKVKTTRKGMKQSRALGKFIPVVNRIEATGPRIVQASTITHETQHAVDDIEGRKYGFGMRYGLRPGERRAFNVEFRRRWTMAQRLALPPWATEEDAVNWAIGGRTADTETVRAVEAKYSGFPLPREEIRTRPQAQPQEEIRRPPEEELPKIANERDKERGMMDLAIPGRVFMSRTEIKAKRRKGENDLPEITDENEIDFDKRLSEQNPVVADKLRKLIKQHNAKGGYTKRGRSIIVSGTYRRWTYKYGSNDGKLYLSWNAEQSGQARATEDALWRSLGSLDSDIGYELMSQIANAKARGQTREEFIAAEIENEILRSYGYADSQENKDRNAQDLDPAEGTDLMPQKEKDQFTAYVEAAWDRVSIDHETAYASAVFDRLAYELGTLGAMQAMIDEGLVAGKFRPGGTDAGQSVIVFGVEITGHDAMRTRWGWFLSLAGAVQGDAFSDGAMRFGSDEELATLVDLVMGGASAAEIFANPVYQKIVAHDEAAVPTLPAEFTAEQVAARVYVEGRNAAQVIDEARRQFEAAAGGPVRVERKATLVFGLPGAGKSTFSKSIAKSRGAALVDSDVILEQIPEYEGGYNSSAVRREASLLRDRALSDMIADGQNLVVERIGDTMEQVRGHVEELRAAGYQVEVVHIAIGQDEAVRRGALRFVETGRYVLPRVYAKAGNETGKVFARALENIPLDGYIEIDAENPRNQAKVLRAQGARDILAGLAPRLAPVAGRASALQRGRGRATPGELFQSREDPLRPVAGAVRRVVGGLAPRGEEAPVEQDREPQIVDAMSRLINERYDGDWASAPLRDIREEAEASLDEVFQGPVRLGVYHNLSADNVIYAAEIGGIPVPSLALTKEGVGPPEGYGEITLIGSREMADPETTPVYDADAWSPRFPKPQWKAVPARTLEASALYKGLSKHAGAYDDSASSELWDKARQSPNRVEAEYVLHNRPSMMAYWLETKGETPAPPVMVDKTLPSPVVATKAWRAFVEKYRAEERYDLGYNTPEAAANRKEAAEAFAAGLRESHDPNSSMSVDQWIDLFEDRAVDPETGEMFFGPMDRYIRAVNDIGVQIVDRGATKEALTAQIGDRVAEYNGFLRDQVGALFAPPTIKVGGRNVPMTLDNIVEAMTGRVKGRENGLTFSTGKTRAVAAKRITSLQEARNRADWQIDTEENIETLRKEADTLLEAYRTAVAEYYGQRTYRGDIDYWNAFDSAQKALSKATSYSMLRAALSREGFRAVPASVIEQGLEARKAMMETPVPYFEAKPQRAVPLSEFKGAVIPTTAPQQVRDILAREGVRYVEYDPSDRQAQNRAAQMFIENIDELFQDQRRPSLEEFRNALIADLRNERAVYSSDEAGAMEEQERLADMRRWFEARGVNLQADKDELRRQIEAVVAREKENPLAVPPDIAAQWFGYEDGQALLDAVSNLPSRERAIEDRMTAMVEREIGDPFADGRIAEEARLAAHLEVQARRLEIELAALQQASGGRATPVGKAAKAFAERQIGMMTVKQVRGYDAFLAQERRSAKAAEERFRVGDFDGAALMKQRQLVNFHLYRLARQAAEEMDRTQDYFKKFDRPTIRAKIATPHLDQIDQALERIDLRKAPPISERRRQGFLAWVAAMTEQGREHEIDVDPAFMEQVSMRPFNTLTLLEARGLRDAIRNFEHIGKRFNQVTLDRKKREYNELVRELVTAIDKNEPFIKDQIKGESATFFEKLNDLRLQAHAEHTKMEFLFRLLDGLKDNGVVWRTLFAPMARAEDAEIEMRNASAQRIAAIFSAYSNDERARMFTRRELVNEVATRLTKAEMLSVALNWGNEGNRAALMDGHKWSPMQVEAVLAKLDKRDWDTVQAIWDWIAEYKPESFALQERLTGIRPQEVEAAPVLTKFGTYAGGYFPLRYDPRRSEKTFKREAKVQTLEEFGTNWIKPQTKKGHLIERTKSGGQRVRLDMGVLTEHVENVIHDITHREAIITTLRLIEDPRVAEAIKGVVGVQMYRVIRPWLAHIAADQRPVAGAIEKIFLRARMGAQVVNMGWKITTAMVQPLGLLNSVPRVGGGEIAAEAAKFLGNPLAMKSAVEFIFARSTMMRNRMQTFDRDVREALGRMKGRAEGDVIPVGVRQSMFWMTGVLDMSVAAPTWLAAYKKAMAGKVANIKADDEKAAVEHADSIVRMTQGAGGLKDLAEIAGRSSQLMKLFTMFYSYMSNLYNQLYVEQRPGVQSGAISKPVFVGNLFFLWLFPAYLAMLVQGRGDKDDDETVEDMIWRQGKEVGLYPLQTIVGVRDAVAALSSGYGYDISPVTDVGAVTVGALDKAGNALWEIITGADGGVDEHELRALMKDTTMAVGYWLGLPARQAWTSGSYAADVLTGREETPWEDPETAYNEGLLRDARDPTR